MNNLRPLSDHGVNGPKTVAEGLLAGVIRRERNYRRLFPLLLLCPLALCIQGCKDQSVLSPNGDSGSGGTSPDPEPRAKVISHDCVLTSGGGQTGANDRFENDCITGEPLVITLSVGTEGGKDSAIRSGFYPPSLIPMAFSALCPSVFPFPFASEPGESLGRFAPEDRKLWPTPCLAKDIP